MILTTDGKGEFILVAEAGGAYEEFARNDEAFASVKSYEPQETGHKTFELTYTYQAPGEWPAGAESRVLVRSPYVYGRERAIRDLKIDVENAYGPTVAITGAAEAHVRVRAITTEFDPETATWDWAYTEGNLGLSTDWADHLLSTSSGIVSASPLPSRRQSPLAAWNELEEIYGFELRIEPVGSEPQWMQVIWRGKLDLLYKPVGYVILR